MSECIIERDKKKILGFSAICLLFLFFSIRLTGGVIKPEQTTLSIVLLLLGGAITIFFVVCLAVLIWQLFSNRPGIVLDQTGFTVCTSRCLKGKKIPWSDVKEIGEHDMMGTKLLGVMLNEPEKYLLNAGMKSNYKECGTPVAFASNNLKIDFRTLMRIFSDFHNRYGNNELPHR